MNRNYLLLFIFGILLFWILRISYWQITYELPFSDMADNDNIAHRIVKNFDFSHDDFWKTYYSPTLPALRAIQILALGDNLTGWQFFQAAITFFSLLWLVCEIIKVSKVIWLGLALPWISALSKSSIFWSLKVATEGIAEGLVYLSAAAAVFALRKKDVYSFSLLGVIFTVSILNKPNMFFVIPIFLVLFSLSQSSFRIKKISKHLTSKTIFLIEIFILAIIFSWSPWLIRSYKLYGQVVPFNTHGPFSFFWELGKVEIKLSNDPSTYIYVTSEQLEKAAHEYPNDYQAYLYGNSLVSLWLKNNWQEYLLIINKRLARIVFNRTIYLTQVSRDILFSNMINYILLDKTPILIFTGVTGLIILAVYYSSYLYILPILAIIPLFTATLFLGYPRMLEPMIPLILFGNCGWIMFYVRKFKNES